MESEVARRRINLIASHFAPNDEISATQVLPMNCSGTLNSVLRRCDNKVYFARQSSASLGYFMRQSSVEEGDSTSFIAPKTQGSSESPADANCSGTLNSALRRCDNKVYFARQSSDSLGYFMRQSSVEEGGSTSFVAPKTHADASESPANARGPCFARPTRTESDFSNSVVQPMAQVQSFDFSALDPPTFARPSRQIGRRDQLHTENKTGYSEINGIEWSPRMDVAESKGRYVITVEVPGVRISDIRVEVDDQKLSVKGRRSSSRWTVAGSPNASFSSYHKREILYGPYEAVWPLPAGVNKDSISAEFQDGFLQILIPKL